MHRGRALGGSSSTSPSYVLERHHTATWLLHSLLSCPPCPICPVISPLPLPFAPPSHVLLCPVEIITPMSSYDTRISILTVSPAPCTPVQHPPNYNVCTSAPSLPVPLTRFLLLHCTSLHFTALHCTTLHFTALHCTSLLYPCACRSGGAPRRPTSPSPAYSSSSNVTVSPATRGPTTCGSTETDSSASPSLSVRFIRCSYGVLSLHTIGIECVCAMCVCHWTTLSTVLVVKLVRGLKWAPLSALET